MKYYEKIWKLSFQKEEREILCAKKLNRRNKVKEIKRIIKISKRCVSFLKFENSTHPSIRFQNRDHEGTSKTREG